MEIIKNNKLEKITPMVCGYINQQGDFYPTIGFDAEHDLNGNWNWMKQDLVYANEYALEKLSKLGIPSKLEEYQKLKKTVGDVDVQRVIDQYIADQFATIKFARLHEQHYGRAEDRTIYPHNEGYITTQALITLSWLYGINYNPNEDFKEVQAAPMKILKRRIGTIVL